jgi:hypothetical protein
MELWDELRDKLPVVIALVAWLVGVAVRTARGRQDARPEAQPRLRLERWPSPSTGQTGAPAKTPEKGYRPIDPS